MSTATPSRLPSAIDRPDELFIGGEWVKPSTDAQVIVHDSGTGQEYVRVALAQAADVERAISAARAAFDDGPWPRMTPSERAGYLRAMAAELAKRSSEISSFWTTETGLLHAYSAYSADGIPGLFEYYARLADTFDFTEPAKPTAGGTAGYIIREPVGVVGVIFAWNGAITQMSFKTAPALLAGCTVVVKPPLEAPSAGYLLAEVAEAVGIPAGVINVVTADREASEQLITDPRVDKITFTGSSAVGRHIGGILGARIARQTLELGGKSAAVILDDFDLGTAAGTLASAATVCTGQVCSALTRIIVTQGRYDELLEAMKATFSALPVGDPFDAGTAMGPLSTSHHRDRVEHYINLAQSEGATLVTGGRRPAHLDRGWFIEPTVFGGVDNSSTIAREEVFGPVVSVIAAADEQDAIRIANDTPYGLNASVFTNDVDRAVSVARQLRSGTVGHNDFRSDFGIAFGGFKQSGIGREGGREGLLPFLEVKTLILEGEPTSLSW